MLNRVTVLFSQESNTISENVCFNVCTSSSTCPANKQCSILPVKFGCTIMWICKQAWWNWSPDCLGGYFWCAQTCTSIWSRLHENQFFGPHVNRTMWYFWDYKDREIDFVYNHRKSIFSFIYNFKYNQSGSIACWWHDNDFKCIFFSVLGVYLHNHQHHWTNKFLEQILRWNFQKTLVLLHKQHCCCPCIPYPSVPSPHSPRFGTLVLIVTEKIQPVVCPLECLLSPVVKVQNVLFSAPMCVCFEYKTTYSTH